MKSSWKRMAGQSAWAMFGQAASALGTLAGFRLITEVVPATVYGIVALAIGLLTLGQWIAIQPLGQAAVRFYADCTSADDGALLRRATIRALMRPTLALAAGLTLGLGAWSLGFQHEALLGPLCGLLFLADGARSVEVFFLSAEREQRTLAWLVAGDAWLRPAFGVVAVLLFGPYAAAVVGGYLAGTLVALAVYYVARRGHAVQVPRDDRSAESMAAITKRLWAYAMPLLMLPIVGWVGSQADRYIVGGLVGLEAAGLYVAVYGIASRPFFVVRDAVELALRQVFYAQFSGGDPKRQRRVFLLWLGAVGGLSLLGWLAIVLLHRQVAGILLASQYRAYSALMIPIAGGYVLYVVSQVVERICYALHDSRGVVLIETSGAVFGVAIGVPMILAYGVEGAAWSVPIYFGLQLVVALWRARSTLRLAGGPQTGTDDLR